jgi:hypothetical protein
MCEGVEAMRSVTRSVLAILVLSVLVTACRSGGSPPPPAPSPTPSPVGQAAPAPAPVGQDAPAPAPGGGNPGQPAPAPGGGEALVVNGVTFQEDPGGLGCPVDLTDATDAQAAESALAFTATYLPEGYAFQYQLAAACQGRVVSVGKVFEGPGGVLNIARWTRRTAALPVADPVAVTVAGKPAVKIGAGTQVILAEQFGITELAGAGLSYAEIVKVAEGISSP